MVFVKTYGDPALYRDYYRVQAGNGLPGYHGTPVMYGSGLGGIFRSLFRKAGPLLKRGLNIMKPHVKTAMQNIATDVVGEVTHAVMNKMKPTTPQEGSGLMYIQRRHRQKRKASRVRLIGPPRALKRKRVSRKKTQKRRAVRKRRSRPPPRSKRDIF